MSTPAERRHRTPTLLSYPERRLLAQALRELRYDYDGMTVYERSEYPEAARADARARRLIDALTRRLGPGA